MMAFRLRLPLPIVALLSLIILTHGYSRTDNFIICGGVGCDECSPPGLRNSPGIGIDLTREYGTAAIRYPNGTTRDLIKVDGTPEYREAMRVLAEDALRVRQGLPSSLEKIDFHDPTERNLYPLSVYSHLPRAWIYNLKAWCRHFTSLRPRPAPLPSDPVSSAIASLLFEIKSSVLDRLDPPLLYNDVLFTVPDLLRILSHETTESYYKTRFDLAAHLAGLRLMKISPVSYNALEHDGVDFWDYDLVAGRDELGALLVVHYSEASLEVTVHMRDELDIPVRLFEWPEYGADALSSLSSTSDESNRSTEQQAYDYWNKVTESIAAAISNCTDPIGYVLLLGSKAREPGLFNALKDVFERRDDIDPSILNRYIPLARYPGYDENEPLFLAARAAAGYARGFIKDGGQDGCYEPHWCVDAEYGPGYWLNT